MFVAIIILMLNGQPVMHGQSEQHFHGIQSEGGCAEWINDHAPILQKEIEDRRLPFTIQARCDALT